MGRKRDTDCVKNIAVGVGFDRRWWVKESLDVMSGRDLLNRERGGGHPWRRGERERRLFQHQPPRLKKRGKKRKITEGGKDRRNPRGLGA